MPAKSDGMGSDMNTGKKNNAHTTIVRRSSLALRLLSAVFASTLLLVGLAACSGAAQPTDSQSANSQGNASGDQGSTTVAEGTKAPDFSFTAVDGKTRALSDFEGQVVLLNFWATWCGYCINEMPAMQKITENYSNVVVLAINRGDNASEANSFSSESGYGFIWGLDEDGAIEKLYPSNGIPYSLIIDRDGTIITIFEGSASDMYPYFESAVVDAGA